MDYLGGYVKQMLRMYTEKYFRLALQMFFIFQFQLTLNRDSNIHLL